MSEFKTPRLERGESIVGSVIHDEARGVQVAKLEVSSSEPTDAAPGKGK